MTKYLLALLSIAGAAHADTITSKLGAIAFEPPKGWTVAPIAGGVGKTLEGWTIYAPGQSSAVIVMVAATKDPKELQKLAEKSLDGMKLHLDKPAALALNGMKGVAVTGTINYEGDSAKIEMEVVAPTPNDHGFYAISMIDDDKYAGPAHKLLTGIKPVK